MYLLPAIIHVDSPCACYKSSGESFCLSLLLPCSVILLWWAEMRIFIAHTMKIYSRVVGKRMHTLRFGFNIFFCYL